VIRQSCCLLILLFVGAQLFGENAGSEPTALSNTYGLIFSPSNIVRPAPSPESPGTKTRFRTYFEPTKKMPFDSATSEFFVGSTVSADYYLVRNARTLTSSPDDEVDQFRQRTDFSFLTRQGIGRYSERSVLDAKVTLGNTIFWRTIWGTQDYKASKLSLQDRIHHPWFLHLQEGWFKVNIDQIVKGLNNHPYSLKVGVFPYFVGRGVSLGDWYQGGNDTLGFRKSGTQRYAPMYPPGLLWSGNVMPNLDYEIYFSPMTIEDVQLDTLSSAFVVTNEKNSNARHIVAARVKSSMQITGNSQTYVEPYFVYYNSPRQTIKRPADAPTRFGTLGIMCDHKVGNFEVNFELAKQYGTQKVLERVYNLAGFVEDNGTISDFATTKTYEYHEPYELKLRGKMGMLDIKYKMKGHPVSVAAALGYFSGDSYPYNDAVDKYLAGEITNDERKAYKNDRDFNGFLPLRDYHYNGLWATPMVMFSAGVVPRPQDLSLFWLTNHNDDDSATNIKFIGGGFKWMPCEDQKKCEVMGNLFWYWEDLQLTKWKKADAGDESVLPSGMRTAYKAEWNTYKVQGWKTDEAASKFLGWELNSIMTYKVADNCELSLRGGVFFPGSIYKDVDGSPNANTYSSVSTIDSKGVVKSAATDVAVSGSLGTSKAYGLYGRIRYIF
jgi:hypothetical protein